MKDTFTKKATGISSCLANCTETVTGFTEESLNKLVPNDISRVRRSAAMIGLAISMGATGMVLSQDKAAIAANSVTANTSLPTLPTLSNSKIESSKRSSERHLAPLAVKHTVKAGESITKLAKSYQVDPVAIAAANNLTISAELQPGQTLKIPAIKKAISDLKVKKAATRNLQTQEMAAKPINTSLDHLRETRKRLQDSLAELKTKDSKPDVGKVTVIADVSDVSRPLTSPETQPKLTISSTKTEINQVSQPVEIPVFSSENEAISTASRFSIEIPEVKPQAVESSSTPSPDSAPAVRVSRKEDKSPTTPSLSTLPSVNETKEVQAEADPSIPLSITTPEADKSEETQTIGVNPPQQDTLRQPVAIVPKPQFTPPKKHYKVQRGDTVNKIARRHGISTAELIRANGITNPNLIKVNQTLIIPQKAEVANSDQPNRNLSNSTLAASVSALRLQENSPPKGFIAPSNQQSPNLELSNAQQSHTEKLRADIVSLQDSYGRQPESITINKNADLSSSRERTVIEEALNSEWSSDRQEVQSPQEAIDQRLDTKKPQLIGTAPSNPGIYNDAFQIPVGTNVGPELPGLSNPDDYLPDAPMKFNGYIWPSKGVITSGFGRRWGRMHKGIDIAAPVGTPIMASAPGEVITAGWNSGGFGNLVKVRHPDGSVTLYAHNSRILVRRGQKVEQGQQIAEMGSTGYSTGPHLHFEIHVSGGAKNPMALLPKERS